MFTGIVETTGNILQKRPDGLTIERPHIFDDLKIGQSICVSGACLSVIGFDAQSMRFDLVPETWSKTNFGTKREGDRVNLERSLKAGDRFEGHIVQGHVEGVGSVVSSGAAAASSIPPPLPPKEEGEHWPHKRLPRNIRFFSRFMRKNPTEAEKHFWQAVRHDQLGVRFRRQYPLGGRIVDFFIPSCHLAIELDGSIHGTQVREDALRDKFLFEEYHVVTLRVSNDAVMHDLRGVLSTIRSAIEKHSPPWEEGLGVEAKAGGEAIDSAVDERHARTLHIELPISLTRFVVPKGSIAIEGVSLTIAKIEHNICSIALIPHTLTHTTLGSLQPGDPVNIETDLLLRWFAHAHRH